jgi:hypothetical protein
MIPEAMSRTWAITEIRNLIFAELDVPSLKAAARVCQLWHRSAVSLLWRQATTQALRCVKPDRRHLYEGAIALLYLSSAANARRASRGWNFPNIDSLLAHPAMAHDAAALAAMLARCGPKLLVVRFTMLSGGGGASSAGSAAPASACALGHHNVCQYSVVARGL